MLGWTVLSQLKQDPATRHIPVQIVTLDEDRQHGLARGAFSFVTKPTTTEGLEAALDAHQGLSPTPRRKRLLVVEDNAAEQLSITRAARPRRHRDRRPPAPARRRSTRCASEPFDCVVLDLRLPDMSGFEVLERIQRRRRAARPAGRRLHRHASCRPRRTRSCTTLARSVVVKGVESPERLLDETALFLHRVVADLPPRQAADARAAAPLRRGPASARRCWWSTTTCATSSR